ncbi:hypothetical protein DENSPDRAFT_882504 [Dentipellis sp. KUC8613]|nr:hypothetical protein DENSPDRAFT_882504 [Dentipellis sp. KUC8613]
MPCLPSARPPPVAALALLVPRPAAGRPVAPRRILAAHHMDPHRPRCLARDPPPPLSHHISLLSRRPLHAAITTPPAAVALPRLHRQVPAFACRPTPSPCCKATWLAAASPRFPAACPCPAQCDTVKGLLCPLVPSHVPRLPSHAPYRALCAPRRPSYVVTALVCLAASSRSAVPCTLSHSGRCLLLCPLSSALARPTNVVSRCHLAPTPCHDPLSPHHHSLPPAAPSPPAVARAPAALPSHSGMREKQT